MATTDLSAYDKTSLPNAKKFRFGMVVSEWNEEITNALFEGALETLKANGALPENIVKWEVPGSFELIYGAKKMVQTQNLDAVIAIGNVIKGETKHFDFVCDGVTQGIKDLNIQQETPVIFCVLTDDTREQSMARSGGVHGNKGVECAVAAIKMAVLKQL
ncbi:MAG: 6,7-dimethyl-8-ribityllumazine synthase [Flavicella sp.]|jgi:6,7-dimethyl-8-ribityllumazine synthase|nr:6,7-dimethyl-8-ribityllumazine synthase [Flavicella sp.]